MKLLNLEPSLYVFKILSDSIHEGHIDDELGAALELHAHRTANDGNKQADCGQGYESKLIAVVLSRVPGKH